MTHRGRREDRFDQVFELGERRPHLGGPQVRAGLGQGWIQGEKSRGVNASRLRRSTPASINRAMPRARTASRGRARSSEGGA